MIDLSGTPYTKSLHVAERYRLREYDDVKEAIERNKKENWLFNGDVFSGHRVKTPWSSIVRCNRASITTTRSSPHHACICI
jgi:hypothetical protein